VHRRQRQRQNQTPGPSERRAHAWTEAARCSRRPLPLPAVVIAAERSRHAGGAPQVGAVGHIQFIAGRQESKAACTPVASIGRRREVAVSVTWMSAIVDKCVDGEVGFAALME